jgi:hypothetical protein
VSPGRLTRAVALGCALTLLFVASAVGSGALVIVNDIILRADGSFHPRALPRQQFAPIDFQGHFDVEARGGGKPVALSEVVVDFDRDGRLGAGGLPICAPEWIASAGPAEARRTCGGAIVGTGHIEAQVGLPSGTVTASSVLTVFNGPRQEGGPTVVLHARTTVPAAQTFAIVVPIERRPGAFRYRARVVLPPIAAGLGAITHLDVKVGRHFEVDGQRHSYIAARCSDGILHTHGRFSFADGTIVDGSVEKPCRAR